MNIHNRAELVGTIAFLTAMMLGPGVSAADSAGLERGEYIYRIAGCRGCHSTNTDQKKKIYLAGGRALKTPFGTYYSPNITPDRKTGIGSWQQHDFIRALRDGKNRDDEHYFPVFPYTSYTRMTEPDMVDLWGYMKTLPPITRPNKNHEAGLVFGSRFMIGPWKIINFSSGPVRPNPNKPALWNRGRYLVDALGHCGECHTPRDDLGGIRKDMYLSGTLSGADGDSVPNITPDQKTGIGRWAHDDIDSLLSMGMLPDGDFVGGSMGEALDNTEFLTANDREAIAAYLKSVPPVIHKIQKPKSAK